MNGRERGVEKGEEWAGCAYVIRSVLVLGSGLGSVSVFLSRGEGEGVRGHGFVGESGGFGRGSVKLG